MLKLAWSVARILLSVMLISTALIAQETRSAIVGRVTDASGAVIAGAQVRATNTSTSVSVEAVSNAEGNYELNYLLPGPYQATVVSPGFKTFVRDNIELRIGERVTLNIAMEVGQIAEQVTVTAQTPLLEAASASLGQIVDTRRVAELPVAHGNPYLLMTLSPGVAYTQNVELDQPYAPTHIVGYSMGGVRANRSEITMDGTPNSVVNHRWGQGDLMAGYTPPSDVVQEMKIESTTFDASVGHTQGGVTSITIKSGGNDLHGTAYYSAFNPALDANLFFANRDGQPRAEYNYHRYGGSLSGPILIPRLYDGRNRTFFTYGHEGIRDNRPRGTILTVPTAEERTGDFSALLRLGPQYQIYDPATRVLLPNGRTQVQPFPNNIIPAHRISPAARNLLEQFPLPNTAGTADASQNFNAVNTPENLTYTNHITRVDHAFSDSNRFFGRFNTYTRKSDYNDFFGTLATGGTNDWPQHAVSLDDVHTFSPNTLLNVRYAFYRLRISQTPKPETIGLDLTTLGLPQYLNDAVSPDERAFPQLQVDGYASSYNGWYSHIHANHNLEAHLTHIRGNHTLRVGADARDYRTYHVEPSNASSGQFIFGNTWTRGPLDNSPGSPKGQGLASLLLGLPTGGSLQRNASYAEQSSEFSLYFQDDWKVARNLTINVGLRYEVETPMTERFNRSVRGFDFNTPNPLESVARANYAEDPLPELPVEDFRFLGGLTFPGVNGEPRTLWRADTNNLMPRIGLAWQLTPRTVIRSGYGIFYGPLSVRRTDVIQSGFSQDTPLIPSLDNGLTFNATLENPFPDGFQNPPGASEGLMTFAGRSVQFFNENPKAPKQQRWQFSIQRELPQRVLVEVGYLGNYGTDLETNINLRALPLEYLSRLPYRDQENLDYLSFRLPNPYFGLLPGTGLAGNTTTRSYLLESGPYTGFTGVNTTDNEGYSWYHSLVAKVERRFSQGFTLNGAYTWSKSMEALSRLNGYYDQLEYVISTQDRPHRIVVSGIWEIPFGRGRRFLGSVNPVADKFLGGWQVSAIYTGQSGAPLNWGNIFFNGNVHDITLPTGERTPDQWFNVDAGFVRAANAQPTFNYRTWPSRLSNVRGDGFNNWDISLLKNTSVGERFRVQFRADFLNAFNHTNFSNPNTSLTSTAFGQVFDQNGYPRRIQLGVKLLF